MDAIVMLVVCVGLLVVAYILYMRKELRGENAGLRSQNGSGEGFYGKKEVREDGSYVATKWFMIFLIPLVPLGTYRVWKGKTSSRFFAGIYSGFAQSTQIYSERIKMDWRQVCLTYLTSLLIAGSIVGASIFLIWLSYAG